MRHFEPALGVEIAFLHGGTSKKARDELVRRFQDDPRGPRVFVLSVQAGGTGLDLTAASHVVHYDRWWNPAVEDQATDRAYRIGQARAVQVHKRVCGGTVEDKIDRMLEQKHGLAASIVGSGEPWRGHRTHRTARAAIGARRGLPADGEVRARAQRHVVGAGDDGAAVRAAHRVRAGGAPPPAACNSRSMSAPAFAPDRDDSPREDHIVVLRGVTWADYQRLLEIRGDQAAPRISYLAGDGRRGTITPYVLRDAAYAEVAASEVLSGLDLAALCRFLDRPTTSAAIREYRDHLRAAGR